MNDELLIKFEGGLADAHRLPAYEASQSLYGISRALLIALNYLDEHRVRRREFNPRGFKINLVAQRPGSFETLFEIITNPDLMAVVKQLGVGVTGALVTDYLKTVLRRSVGKSGEASIEQLETDGSLDSGDLGAVEDAIEPAMKAAHTVINRGAGHIVIIQGDNNVVTFDRETKEYVWTSKFDETPKVKIFSIASYNANQRSGRAFDFDLGKTIPFEVAKDADRETFSTVLSSISSYAMRRLGDDLKSAIAVKYTSVISADEKVKEVIILRARKEIAELGG